MFVLGQKLTLISFHLWPVVVFMIEISFFSANLRLFLENRVIIKT